MKVVGGKILVIGDLHISDVYKGRHISYLTNCFVVLGEIEKKVNELNPSAIVFLGDIVGMNESNIRSREVLSQLCKWFMRIGEGRKIFCVRGNHDAKGYPEFQFLSDLRLFETSGTCDGYFDYYGYEGQEEPEIRFHLVDYKQESRPLAIATGSTSNIVFAHNNFTIQGCTTWYPAHDGIELAMLQNFVDVDMVICGHIHIPSPEFYSTQMVNGQVCTLFYLGCPTRPTRDQDYDKCWYFTFEYDEKSQSTGYDALDFNLLPSDEIFYKDEDFIEDKTEEELANEVRTQALKEVLGDIMKYRMCQGNLLDSIDAIPNATDDAKECAKKYLSFALNTKQS